MMHEHEHNQHASANRRFNWGLIGAVAVIAYFLLAEHRAHFIQALPYLLLLACPLLHLFMHRGHGDDGSGAGHRHSSNHGKERDEK